MNQYPLVSVIIPVYNVDKYLRECLDSVCNQTYRNLQIICVDDGSTDTCPSILREYAQKDNRIIVLTQANAGQAAARNAALEIAEGEWIASVDSDDYVDVTLIEKCLQHIDEDIDVVCFCVRYFADEDNRTLKGAWLDKPFSVKQKVTETLIPKLMSFFVDKLWRRTLIENSGCSFPEGLIFEDFCFTRRVLSLASYTYCLPDKLYHYRKRSGSSMDSLTSKKDKRVLNYIEVGEICLSFWKQHNIRERFGCKGPSYLEMNLLNHSCANIRQWAGEEIQHQAWFGIRALIDKYELGSRLPEFQDLALYYHLPPYVYNNLAKKVNRSAPNHNELKKQMILLADERRIYWNYRRIQLLCLLTWGKKHRKYKEKRTKYHDLVRQCRAIRKQLYKQFHL